MKTAEEHFAETDWHEFALASSDEQVRHIKQIQLDAMREGMRRAVEIIRGDGCCADIRQAADQLTIDNL